MQRCRQAWKQAGIAEAIGVSRKCVATWIKRDTTEGDDGLHDRSSRPHPRPSRTSAEIEQKILATRAEHRRGRDWPGPELGVPPRKVTRILFGATRLTRAKATR